MLRRSLFWGCFVCVIVMLTGSPAWAERDFNQFIQELKRDYAKQGISDKTLSVAFQSVSEPIPRIIELDRNQPEFKLTLTEYLSRVVPQSRISKAREKYIENKSLLDKVSAKYNVPPQIIVALWGIETDFGRVQGGYDVVPALVTLIYDGRREAFFRRELLNALQILEEGHVSPAQFKGSWAGAMGQSQFMPSSFMRFAVDADGDGRKDIWGTKHDVFASIANYLSQSGWRADQRWGRQVKLPANFNYQQVTEKTSQPLGTWQAQGVRRLNGADLPQVDIEGRIILPEGEQGRAFLVYNNFDTILRWNRSDFFAIAAGTLADAIVAR